jgi:hypothetical protein
MSHKNYKGGKYKWKESFFLFYFLVTFFRDDEAIHSETAAAGQPPSKK